MNSIKVSVTVPVYNTSRYLKQCVDSLKSQELEDIEFIIVDDGSTDESLNLCKEYTKNDYRFRIIHQNNGGLAAARQTGLIQAKGEYIIVCDSDDWVEPTMYKHLYNVAKEKDADIAVCGYNTEYNDGKSVPTQILFKENLDGVIDNMDFLINGAGSPWIKLIKREFFDKSKASYTPGINLGEDALIIYKLMKSNPVIVQTRAYLYHYRRLFGEESYTNRLKMSHIGQLIWIYDWLKLNYPQAEYRSILRQRAFDIAFAGLRASDCDDKVLNNFISKEISWNKIFQGSHSLKSAMVIVEKVFPLSVARFFLQNFYKYFYK